MSAHAFGLGVDCTPPIATTEHQILFIPSCSITSLNQLTPGDTLYRCVQGLKLWQSGRYDRILLAGGVFLPSSVQTTPASTLMMEWLVEQGVSRHVILCETQSVDTFENIRYGVVLLQREGLWPCRITVATQWQHAIRILITFWRLFDIWISPKFLHQPTSWRTWFMEWAFILYHLYDRQGTKSPAAKRRAALRQQAV